MYVIVVKAKDGKKYEINWENVLDNPILFRPVFFYLPLAERGTSPRILKICYIYPVGKIAKNSLKEFFL